MIRFGALLVLAAVAAPALADPTTVTVNGGATSGSAQVNVASGNLNQQANTGVVASGSLAESSGSVSQHQGDPPLPGTSAADASIAPGAFAGSGGWTAVNGAAGNNNQQANLASFAFGIEVGTAADIALSQTRSSQEPAGSPGDPALAPERSATIGGGAFAGSSGLVQVSLIGGDRNTSANSFVMSVEGATKP